MVRSNSIFKTWSLCTVMVFMILQSGSYLHTSNVVVSAFVPRSQQKYVSKSKSNNIMIPKLLNSLTSTPQLSSTSLSERRWNFNEGQGPFGLKKNAETWNGRVAQMAFVFVFIQEAIFGKGIVQGLSEGDPIYIACMALFFASVTGLTIFLAIKGADNYVDKDLGRK